MYLCEAQTKRGSQKSEPVSLEVIATTGKPENRNKSFSLHNNAPAWHVPSNHLNVAAGKAIFTILYGFSAGLVHFPLRSILLF